MLSLESAHTPRSAEQRPVQYLQPSDQNAQLKTTGASTPKSAGNSEVQCLHGCTESNILSKGQDLENSSL